MKVLIFKLLLLFFTFTSLTVWSKSAPIPEPLVILTEAEKAWIVEHPQIIAATSNDWPPFEFVDSHGNAQGINIDILELIAARTGLKITTRVGYWADNLTNFKEGKLDLLIGVKHLAQREKIGVYSQQYLQVLDYFFAHKLFQNTPFDELATKRIAVPKEYATHEFIKTNFPQLTIIDVDSLYGAVDAVLEGRADVLFNNYQTVSYILHQEGISDIVPVKSMRHSGKSPIYMMTPTDKPLLNSIINKGLASITDKEKQSLTKIHMGLAQNELFERLNRTNIELTSEEKAYLAAHPTISVTGDPKWLPYEGIDSQGNYVGIVPEILDIFEQRLGIAIERKIGRTWQESVTLFQTKQVEVISETYDAEVDEGVQYSNVYLSSPIVIVMRDSHHYVNDMQSIAHLKMGLIKDYGYTAQIMNAYPKQEFLALNTINEGLTAVATGKVDVLFATLAQASYHIASLGINNVRIVGETPFKTQLALGVHQENKILASIFNKALQSIPSTEKQAIINRWSKDKFVSHVDYVLIVSVVVGALIVMTFIILWYQKLLREIRARQEAQSNYKALLNLLPTQVMVVSEHGKILSANGQVMHDYDISESEIIGKPFVTLLKEAKAFSDFTDLVDRNSLEQIITEFSWQEKVHSMMLSMLPITYEDAPAYLTLAVDITERITMEKMMIEAKNAAIDANKAKTSFLANMSHEIRTPMNAIIGFTELLFNEVRDPKMVSYIKTIRSAGSSLLLLINDILDLSKIESGKLHLQHKATNLHQMIDDIAQVFEVDIQKKSLGFEVIISESVPQVVMLDESRLRQVLFNLIGNAVKFTHHGHITLKIEANCGTDHADITVSITDTGIGISRELQSIIFDSFVQPKHQDVAQYGGSGLGLAISKRLINLMKGRLKVQSELNVGSSFNFTLPQVEIVNQEAFSTQEVTEDNGLVSFNGLSVLVADDVDDNRQLLEQMLPKWDLRIDTAVNGQIAIDKAKQYNYDLILLDIRMPVVDGYQAATKIRELRPSVPIVAITASVMSDEEEISKRHHFDGYLRKPVLQKDIINELKRHLSFAVTSSRQTRQENVDDQLLLTNDLKQQLQQKYLSQCQQLLENNNIDDFNEFIGAVSQLAKSENNESLLAFTHMWQQAVDCLDVIEIQRFTHKMIIATID